jgi:hypothetical protein
MNIADMAGGCGRPRTRSTRNGAIDVSGEGGLLGHAGVPLCSPMTPVRVGTGGSTGGRRITRARGTMRGPEPPKSDEQ